MSKRMRAASLGSAPASFSPLEKGKADQGGLMIDAVLLEWLPPSETPKAPRSCKLLPLGVHKLMWPAPLVKLKGAADGAEANEPMYARATADGEAIVLRVTRAAGGAKGSEPLYELLETPVLITNGVPLFAGMFRPSGLTEAEAYPPPMTMQRVFGLRVSVLPAKGQYPASARFNLTSMSSASFADVNALPLTDRLTVLFPATQQRLAHVQVLADACGLDKTDRALRDLPVPVALVAVNRAYTLGQKADEPFAVDPVLPERGLPDDADENTPGLITGVQDSAPMVREPPKLELGKEEKSRLSLTLMVKQRNEPGDGDDQEERRFSLRNMTLWPEQLATAGAVYPRYLDKLLRYNPIPFYMLCSVNVLETCGITQNFDPPEARQGFEDGILVTRVVDRMAAIRLAEYLERRGIPVTEGFLRARYGNRDSIKAVLPADYTRVVENAELKDVVNLYADENTSLQEYGLLAFDNHTTKMLPDNLDGRVRYWGLPLFLLKKAPPMVARADPGSHESGDDLPLAVDLRPEQGDDFIKESLPMTPVKLDDWLQPAAEGETIRVPYWLFFATGPKARLTSNVTPLMARFAHAPQHLENSGLPATRLALVARMLAAHKAGAPMLGWLSDAPPVAGASDVLADQEPSPKRARTEAATEPELVEDDAGDFDD